MNATRLDKNELSIFDLPLQTLTMAELIERITQLFFASITCSGSRKVYFVNTHTATLAISDPEYHAILSRGDILLPDGTGIRLAGYRMGVKLHNLNGTDVTPAILNTSFGVPLRVYMLGADEASNRRAAEHVRLHFPRCLLVGHHDGYIHDHETNQRVIGEINRLEPHLVLVGMGNPLQEAWIDANAAKLNVAVCMGVGGLFKYWSGTLYRAPPWIRKIGFEWLQICTQQPRRIRRYVQDVPIFLWQFYRWSVKIDDRSKHHLRDTRPL